MSIVPIASKYAATSSYTMSPGLNGIGISLDGGGFPIAPGTYGFIQVPRACVIKSWKMFADQTGVISVDIWKTTYDNYPPTENNSMPGSSSRYPTISGSLKASSDDVTTWSTSSIAANDIISFYVPTVATNIQKCTLQLNVNA